MVGKVQLQVSLPAGTRIELLHAEVLDAQGNFYIGNLRSAKQTVVYVCKGQGEERYAPHFTFQGFRYVKVIGWAGLAMQYKRVIFRPRPDSGLTYAKASLITNYGEVRSEWTVEEDGAVSYTFQLPPNTSGEAILHGTRLSAVTCNGQTLGHIPGIKTSREIEGYVSFELGSGIYQFRVYDLSTVSLSF